MEELLYYEYMWDEKKEEYFLLKGKNGDIIFRIHDGKFGFEVIEDDELYKLIVMKLEEYGNRKFNNMDEVKHYLEEKSKYNK